jgi:acetoin utilization protein AcuB
MRVADVMNRRPITAPPTISVVAAQKLMADHGIRHLLVTGEGGELLGIVTDRDVRRAMPSPATSLSVWEMKELLANIRVEEIMTTGVITIGPDRDARDAAWLMLEHKIGALPVMDEGQLVGIMTETDLLRLLAASG